MSDEFSEESYERTVSSMAQNNLALRNENANLREKIEMLEKELAKVKEQAMIRTDAERNNNGT